MIDRDDAACGSVSAAGGDGTGGTRPFRQRARERLGVSRRQWEYLVAVAIVVPYAVAIGAYVQFDVDEQVFLLVTGAYSLLAMYGSYKL
jgi:hypothetical protein